MTKIIDLSMLVSNKGNLTDQPQIQYSTHDDSVERAKKMFGIEKDELRDGQYAAMEYVTMTTHATSHLDAPYHFASTSEGKPSKTIDQVPLEWCYSDGVVLDFHHKTKGERKSSFYHFPCWR